MPCFRQHDREGRCRQPGRAQLAFEDVFGIENTRHHRVVADVGDAEKFHHGRSVRHRTMTLDTAGVQPGKMGIVLPERFAEPHVIGHQADFFAPGALHRGGDIAGDSLIALPRARVARRLDHSTFGALVAPENHCKTQA